MSPVAEGNKAPQRCFLEISVDGKVEGRVVIEVYPDKMPVSSDNFLKLCTGELHTRASDLKMDYKDTKFHAIRPSEKLIIGGDWKYENGCGGFSIHPGGKFANEPEAIKADKPGAVSFLAEGEHCSSIFSICVIVPEADHYKGYHPFGFVVEGLDVIDRVCKFGDDVSAKPSKDVRITDCGKL
jgi:cyclophilin family peptidyl-prolyl cis-trans isomerase